MTTSPRLSQDDIETAVRLLEGWTDKLTWDRYLAVLATEIGHLYSKVAMHKQPRIIDAWEHAKTRIEQSIREVGAKSNGSAAVAAAIGQRNQYKERADRLQRENEVLLERFQRWSFNAYKKGMTEEELDRPLPTPPDKNPDLPDRHRPKPR